MASSSTASKVAALVGITAGAIAIWQFLKNQCGTAGSSIFGMPLAGGTICNMFGYGTAAPAPAPQQTGGAPAQPPATTPSTPATPPAPPPPPSGNASGLSVQDLGTQLYTASGNAPMLTIDGWNYYYNAILVKRGQQPVSPDQFGSMMAAAGLTDQTRSNPINSQQFVAALQAVGLSGLGYRGYYEEIPPYGQRIPYEPMVPNDPGDPGLSGLGYAGYYREIVPYAPQEAYENLIPLMTGGLAIPVNMIHNGGGY